MNKITDQKQREQALDPTSSYIVQAPAGSGKTSLLIQRYLILLANAQKVPEEILAITFTKKAAEEMLERIISALNQAKHEPHPCDPHKLKLWQLAKAVLERDRKSQWDIMKNPNRLRIQTIDSFCAGLVKQMPVLSESGQQTTIAEGQDAKECYTTAARNLLSSLEDDEPWTKALEILLYHLDNDYGKAETQLVKMLQKRDQWLPHIIGYKSSYDKLQQILENNIANIINENIENIENSLTALPSAMQIELMELIEFAIPSFNKLNQLDRWQAIANLLLRADNKWRAQVNKNNGFPAPSRSIKKKDKELHTQMKQKMENLLETLVIIDSNEQLRESLEAIKISLPPKYSEQQWQVITSIINLLTRLTAELDLVFREKQTTDYIAISMAADRALGNIDNPTDLAMALDYKIQHILVDEFQDTSASQYRLLEKLTAEWQPKDGRTLFLVGDPMQSIYKFREAKVGLFFKAKHYGINYVKLNPITLSANFRSEQYLVDWVNCHFPKVLPNQENVRLGAVPFIQSTATKNTAIPMKVNTYLISEKDYDYEAQQVVDIVQQVQQANPEEKIAILVRSRTHLSHIIPALKAANLSYNAVELETLNESIVIQDLLALTKALLNPADRISWLAILRAPWCGLLLADLTILAGDDNWDKPLLETILNYRNLPNLSIDAQSRLQRMIDILNPNLQNRGRKNLRQWIEDIWLGMGGAYCIKTADELENAKIFFDLLNEQDSGGSIENMPLLETKLFSTYSETSSSASDNLQIMTIHKAKGLEFDTVIIPGLDREPKKEDKVLLMWAEYPSKQQSTDSELILAPISAVNETSKGSLYDYLCHEDKKKRHHENGRLLYVAATRAKKNLHLLACGTDIGQAAKGSLLNQIQHCFADAQIIMPNLPVEAGFKPACTAAMAQILTRLPSNWQSQYKPNYSLHSQKFTAKLELPDATLPNIGTVLHNCFAQLSKIVNPENWLEKNLAVQRQFWNNQLIQLGTFVNLEQHIATIENTVKTTLADPKGKWILSNKHQQGQSEFELTTVADDKIQNFIIDRTFIDNGIRWIIDYKTTIPKNSDITAFVKQQYEFHHKQLEKYAQTMQYLDDKPIRLGLYFPMISKWYEWEYK